MLGQTSHLSLTASFDPDSEKNNLEVNICTWILTMARTKEMKATYTCGGEIDGKDLIMWPELHLSKKWHRYLCLFRACLTTSTLKDYPFQALPFVGEEWSRRIIPDNRSRQCHCRQSLIIRKSMSSTVLSRASDCKCQVAKNRAIYSSDIRPLRKFRILHKIKWAFRTIPSAAQHWALTSGSTNTSIADPLPTMNRPRESSSPTEESLCCGLAKTMTTRSPHQNHLFFFQSNPLLSNAIKSTLVSTTLDA